MADLLVPLYSMPGKTFPEGYSIRRPMSCESTTIQSWVEENFSSRWAAEVLPALSRVPATMFIAVHQGTGEIAGFCCWDCTALGFLGPVGTHERHRGKYVGKALALSVLHSMRDQGYGYAVVGDAGPAEFFVKTAGAVLIENSNPGIYPEKLL